LECIGERVLLSKQTLCNFSETQHVTVNISGTNDIHMHVKVFTFLLILEVRYEVLGFWCILNCGGRNLYSHTDIKQ
jgi:hypothetical protein